MMVSLLAVSGTSLAFAGATYYVDCSEGDDANDGLSESAPWKTSLKVNSQIYQPGDNVLFKRGSVCSGYLWPNGSGVEGSPITLGSYGTGPRPIIDGGQALQSFRLVSQEYWHIENLEFRGGTKYGIHITGSSQAGNLRHFRLTNLSVHDVYGGPIEDKFSGLVLFESGAGNNTFEDVVIDNVTAFNTNQWAGIKLRGGPWPVDLDNPTFSKNITVRNSTVHNVYGDGIIITYVSGGLIEYCVAYDTGQQPVETVGSPSAIWTWSCYDCTVQFNEAYRSDSPTVDAGCFDIDWYTRNNLYQYNYGHDSQGYCQSVFGAANSTTTNAVVRYNVCSNNVRDAALAERQGTIFISTWDGGSLDGVKIYNNTIYYNPAADFPALKVRDTAVFVGSNPNFFKNNIIYSTVPSLTTAKAPFEQDYNLYWTTSSDPVRWDYQGITYNDLNSLSQQTGQESNSLYADPKLQNPGYHGIGRPLSAFALRSDSPAVDSGANVGSMGNRDFFGNEIPVGDGFDIGANEWSGSGSSEEHQLYFAQFAEGLGQLSSEIKVMNSDQTETASGSILLRDDLGQPLSADLNGMEVDGELRVSIPPKGLRVYRTDGQGPLSVGSAEVVSDKPLAGVLLFSGQAGSAGVGASPAMASGFSAPMEVNSSKGVSTGIAMMNLEDQSIVVELTLTDIDGNELAFAEVALDGMGHLARFVDQFEWDVSIDFSNFEGVLVARTAGKKITATVLQTYPGEFSTLPVVPQ